MKKGEQVPYTIYVKREIQDGVLCVMVTGSSGKNNWGTIYLPDKSQTIEQAEEEAIKAMNCTFSVCEQFGEDNAEAIIENNSSKLNALKYKKYPVRRQV